MAPGSIRNSSNRTDKRRKAKRKRKTKVRKSWKKERKAFEEHSEWNNCALVSAISFDRQYKEASLCAELTVCLRYFRSGCYGVVRSAPIPIPVHIGDVAAVGAASSTKLFVVLALNTDTVYVRGQNEAQKR